MQIKPTGKSSVDPGNVTDRGQSVVPPPPCPACEAAARERNDLRARLEAECEAMDTTLMELYAIGEVLAVNEVQPHLNRLRALLRKEDEMIQVRCLQCNRIITNGACGCGEWTMTPPTVTTHHCPACEAAAREIADLKAQIDDHICERCGEVIPFEHPCNCQKCWNEQVGMYVDLRSRLAALMSLLTEIEWDGDQEEEICPRCWRIKALGHADDCALDAQLRADSLNNGSDPFSAERSE